MNQFEEECLLLCTCNHLYLSKQFSESVYFALVKYSIIPIRSCQLDQHTLQFSKEAISNLFEIDEAINETMNSGDGTEKGKKVGQPVCSCS